MPKKLNFLGGMQNYNPNNGEYEPALKGPNGESPKSFANFSKDKGTKESTEKKESTKTKNNKKIVEEDDVIDLDNKSIDITKEAEKIASKVKQKEGEDFEDFEGRVWSAIHNAYYDTLDNDAIDEISHDLAQKFYKEDDEPKVESKYFKHPQVDGLWKDTGKTFEKNGNTYKVFENEEGTKWGVSDKFASQFEKAEAPKVEKKPEDYEGVKTTPYGFIYNVNGKSITDLKEQSKKLGLGNASGYSLTSGGDESYYKTFEEAYKAAKGK